MSLIYRAIRLRIEMCDHKLSRASVQSILFQSMTRNTASTKATGGGGYTFADKVAAALLAQLLRRGFPVDPEFGAISELHFEARDTGQILDDLRLVLKRGSALTHCGISVKSNRQLTKAGFNQEFVVDAWDDWNREGFKKETDLLGLIVGVIDAPTLDEWRELQKQDFATTPERLVATLRTGLPGRQSHRKHAARPHLGNLNVVEAKLPAQPVYLPSFHESSSRLDSDTGGDGPTRESTVNQFVKRRA
jgi:hypothetical protein